MNENVASGPWILVQLLRIRSLEAEVRGLLGNRKPSGSVLRRRMAELNWQVTLLDLELSGLSGMHSR